MINKIVGIAGDSASGKTTLSKMLSNSLKSCTILECDRYHKWPRKDSNWKNITHLNPSANFLELLEQDLKDLKNNKIVSRRDYDHSSGQFTEEKIIYPNDILVCCGLHSLYCSDYLFDFKIYMNTSDALKRHWKINRDVTKRGYSVEKVLEQLKIRKADYIKYIEPQKYKADLIINFFSDNDANTIDISKWDHTSLFIFIKSSFNLSYFLEAFPDYKNYFVIENCFLYNKILFKNRLASTEYYAFLTHLILTLINE
jgi:uridine kinase